MRRSFLASNAGASVDAFSISFVSLVSFVSVGREGGAREARGGVCSVGLVERGGGSLLLRCQYLYFCTSKQVLLYQ